MEQFQLFFDKRVPKLEKENRWKSAVDVVFSQWIERPADLNCLLCAGTQLWYTLLIQDELRNDPLGSGDIEFTPESQLKNCLMKVTQYGLTHFSGNSIYNAYFGYMISVMPCFFVGGGDDYLDWERRGIEMICASFKENPDNLLAKAFFYELDGYGKNTPFYDICMRIWSEITPEQWGNSEVQQYFFRILHGDSFYTNAYH